MQEGNGCSSGAVGQAPIRDRGTQEMAKELWFEVGEIG